MVSTTDTCDRRTLNTSCVVSEIASEPNEEPGSPVLPKLFSARSRINLVTDIDVNLCSLISIVTGFEEGIARRLTSG